MPIASAKTNHMKLLAVKETKDGYEGSTADLYLELKPGSGRVFLDTYPLTKLDTQMSTRFAKEIACDFLDVDCDNYDFIYTIQADSAIIGGPSAGAAISTLTIASLLNIQVDETTTITGTINSGGLIGPVGGIKEKVKAASTNSLKKVIIPKGERFIEESPEEKETIITVIPIIGILNETINRTFETNITKAKEKTTIDLIEYGKELGIEVIEAADLNEASYILTGKTIKKPIEAELVIDPSYIDTMKRLAIDLCDRSESLKKESAGFNAKFNHTFFIELENEASNLTEKGKNAFSKDLFYSSASFCFGANVKYSNLLLLLKNLTTEEISIEINKLKEQANVLNKQLKREKKTISDLESFMVVKERLIEAEEFLNEIQTGDPIQRKLSGLAYAKERVYSAFSWYKFFDNRGKEFNLDKNILEKACKDKLAEADERYQYVKSIFLKELENTKKGLDYAYSDSMNGDFELCLFKANKAKAEIDMMLSVIGVKEEKIKNLIEQKQSIVKKNIIKEQQRGIFPILGYSYYEYANTLLDSGDYSSPLIYSEYALELSNLEMYFKERRKIPFYEKDRSAIYAFALGILVGLLVGIQIKKGYKPKNKKQRKKG